MAKDSGLNLRMIGLGGIIALTLVSLPDAALSADEYVRTIAGSGALGMQDGAAASATFLVPGHLARGRDGTIYVSDEAAQRIRAIKDGRVSTIAGSGRLGPLGMSVIGGDKDGPALSAQFNHPMGLAVGSDDALYIADSYNKKIRKLAHGVITTAVTGLTSPRSIAFDSTGNLWIADYGGGLKRWDGHTLSVVALPSFKDDRLLSLSISPDADDPTLMALTPAAVYEYHLNNGNSSHILTALQEEGDFGTPREIAALGENQALFTDPVADNVQYLRYPVPPFLAIPYTTTVAGGHDQNGIRNGGFRDGTNARFYRPRGLLVDRNTIVIADVGNRRIRAMQLPRFRMPESGIRNAAPYDSSHYEIALIGPSTTFWDSHDDADSICGRIEQRLNGSHRLSKPARCHTHRIEGAGGREIVEYIKSYLVFRKIDAYVILLSPSALALWFPGAQYDPVSSRTLEEGSALFRASLRPLVSTTKSQWLLAWWAEANLVSDSEYLDYSNFPDDALFEHRRVERVTFPMFSALAHVAQYDLFPDLIRYEKQNNPPPLFAATTGHPNARGNAFIADGIANALLGSMAQPLR